jgi:toxin ParE1/3/4
MQISFLQNWRKNILDKYKVKINPKAIRELDSIYEYIANEKLAPENAKGQIDRIKKGILNLDTFPQSHQERNEGRYAGKGYRQLLIDNYIAIFRIDETCKTVYVVTIQYQGRNL